MNLDWKYSFSSRSLKLFEGDRQVGSLRSNIWTPFFSQGELYGNHYVFKPRDFFSKTLIINADRNEVEGFIKRGFHPTIKLLDQQASKLNFKNIWMTNVMLVGNEKFRIQSLGGYFKGKLSGNEGTPPSLILASIYAKNKVWEIGFFLFSILAIWLASRSF